MTDAVEKVRVSRLTTPLGRFGPTEIGAGLLALIYLFGL
jgi:hypothetical protein